MRRTLFCLLLALAVGPVQAALPQPVATRNGLLQGEYTEKTGMAVFRGVPFAAPPVGANRWREPQPVADWSGIRAASSFGPRCIQGGFAPGANQPLTSEDCLYLNVWT